MFVLIIYFVLLFHTNTISIKIGLIKNARLTGSILIINETCIKCICMMITSTKNIQSLNCFPFNNTCELFTEYPSLNIYEIKSYVNSMFYFVQLPSMNTNKTSTNMNIKPAPTTTKDQLLSLQFLSTTSTTTSLKDYTEYTTVSQEINPIRNTKTSTKSQYTRSRSSSSSGHHRN